MVHGSGIIWSITSGKHADTNVFILILYLRKSNTQHCVMLHPSSLKMGPLPVSLRCQKLVRLPTLNLVSFSSVFQLLSVAASRAQPVATWKCRHARSSQRCRKQIHESINVSFIYGCTRGTQNHEKKRFYVTTLIFKGVTSKTRFLILHDFSLCFGMFWSILFENPFPSIALPTIHFPCHFPGSALLVGHSTAITPCPQDGTSYLC